MGDRNTHAVHACRMEPAINPPVPDSRMDPAPSLNYLLANSHSLLSTA
jgi:hypothetical protein